MKTFVVFPFFSPMAFRKSPGKLAFTMRCGQHREGTDVGHCLYVALSKSCRDDLQRHFIYIYIYQTILRKFWDEKKRATTDSDSGEWRPQIASFHSKTPVPSCPICPANTHRNSTGYMMLCGLCSIYGPLLWGQYLVTSCESSLQLHTCVVCTFLSLSFFKPALADNNEDKIQLGKFTELTETQLH